MPDYEKIKVHLDSETPEAADFPAASFKTAALGFTASITFIYATAFLLSTIS